jgi:hypothetical protein
MHGERVKIINARQAKVCNSYKNTKLKLLKTNAALWFNKMCKIKQLKPNYIHIKINNSRLQDKKTRAFAIRYRINQEIKFLYCKKPKLNAQLYQLHLQCAYQCNGVWQHIYDTIDDKLTQHLKQVH